MRREIAGAITGLVIGVASQASLAATFNVVTDFNNTGIQPAAGNPFTAFENPRRIHPPGTG
jgi:hypothetical protein